MYSLALRVRSFDREEELLDETVWPLSQNMPNQWWRGVHGTKGVVFSSLTEVVSHYNSVKAALEEQVIIKDPLVAKLWESIVNTRGAVKCGASDNQVVFDLQIVSHQPVILQTTPLDL